MSSQKSLTFLYTNNEKSEREIKKSIPFAIATKIIKYLGINLPKETKELYTENHNTFIKEIKDDINRWRDTMFLDWKNQYCENDYTTKSNLQIQCNGNTNCLEKEMATHSSILTWRISWTDEPGELQSMGSQRVGHD